LPAVASGRGLGKHGFGCYPGLAEQARARRRWVNRKKARHFEAHLWQDRFGDWTLLKIWDGCGACRVRRHSTGVASYAAGLDALGAFGERRGAFGYDRAG
jgi:hypothetical protein